MSEYALAVLSDDPSERQLTATAYDSATPVQLTFSAGSQFTLGLVEDENGLGVVPRALRHASDYRDAVNEIESKTYFRYGQDAHTGIDLQVGGGFATGDIYGGRGADRVVAAADSTGRFGVFGFGGADTLSGGAGRAYLIGGDGDDVITGGGGDDLLYGERGDDLVDGGDGFDSYSFGLMPGGGKLVVDLSATGPNARGEGHDTLISIEKITGGYHTDNHLTGDGADNVFLGGTEQNIFNGGGGDDALSASGKLARLAGGAGDDTLSGAAKVDRLSGGDGDDLLVVRAPGKDVLSGGAGADTFVIGGIGPAIDRIIDFDAADRIDLSQIDADTSTSKDNAFHLVEALDGHAGEAALVQHPQNGFAELLLDVDGDGQSDETVIITGQPTADGFVL